MVMTQNGFEFSRFCSKRLRMIVNHLWCKGPFVCVNEKFGGDVYHQGQVFVRQI